MLVKSVPGSKQGLPVPSDTVAPSCLEFTSLNAPFSHPPDHSLGFPFQKPLSSIMVWNYKFMENLHSRASKLGASSVQYFNRPQI